MFVFYRYHDGGTFRVRGAVAQIHIEPRAVLVITDTACVSLDRPRLADIVCRATAREFVGDEFGARDHDVDGRARIFTK